jgi:tetratricopeptide (TPR) repeat protein
MARRLRISSRAAAGGYLDESDRLRRDTSGMTVKMPLAIRLLRKVRGKPNRKDASWAAQNTWAFIKRHDWGAAVYFAQGAIASDPTWSEGYRMLALAYRGQHRLADARPALQEALDAGFGDFRLLVDFGELERSDGQYAAAERMYRRALELLPDNTEAMWKLARSLEGQGRLEEATDVLTRARVLSPDDVLVAKALGDVLTESGHYDEALPLLEEVTLREPD